MGTSLTPAACANCCSYDSRSFMRLCCTWIGLTYFLVSPAPLATTGVAAGTVRRADDDGAWQEGVHGFRV
jgi:hypothetical protein